MALYFTLPSFEIRISQRRIAFRCTLRKLASREARNYPKERSMPVPLCSPFLFPLLFFFFRLIFPPSYFLLSRPFETKRIFSLRLTRQKRTRDFMISIHRSTAYAALKFEKMRPLFFVIEFSSYFSVVDIEGYAETSQLVLEISLLQCQLVRTLYVANVYTAKIWDHFLHQYRRYVYHTLLSKSISKFFLNSSFLRSTFWLQTFSW